MLERHPSVSASSRAPGRGALKVNQRIKTLMGKSPPVHAGGDLFYTLSIPAAHTGVRLGRKWNMADQPDPNFPPYRDSETAPIIYFDVIAGTGVMHGAVQIELASRILTPVPAGPVQIGFMASRPIT